jgi:hypothetical protein
MFLNLFNHLKSFWRDATRRPPIHAHRIPPRFFDAMQGDIHVRRRRF